MERIVFSAWPLVVDPRVSRNLQICVVCEEPLADIIAADKNVMLRVGLCKPCGRMYVLDDIYLPEPETDRRLVD